MMFDEYQDRVGELITGIIQQSDKRYTLVQLRERVEALLPKSEQVYNERYDHGMRVKAVITDVSDSIKGPSIVVSRRNPELIKKLFELEVPEIADKLVEIVGVAREPGYRSKIAVVSHADGVDPVGACVGPRGSRVRMVVSELRGEKIDIIPHNDEPARFVAKALSPARVREVLVDDEDKQATVIVPDDQLSLAIGRDGQNARLAARLTGWRVDIKSETEFAQEEEQIELRGRGGLRRPLHGDALQRPPLPERRDRRLDLLRPAAAPGAVALRDQPGGGPHRRWPTRRSRPSPTPRATRRRSTDRREGDAEFEEARQPSGRAEAEGEAARSRSRPRTSRRGRGDDRRRAREPAESRAPKRSRAAEATGRGRRRVEEPAEPSRAAEASPRPKREPRRGRARRGRRRTSDAGGRATGRAAEAEPETAVEEAE